MSGIEVTQADRDAVQAFHREMGNRLLADIKNGTHTLSAKGDDSDLIYQSFAAHRIASDADLRRKLDVAREAIVMAVAQMMRARGRLDIIAGCNDDRRLAAALSGTCDFLRTALATINGESA